MTTIAFIQIFRKTHMRRSLPSLYLATFLLRAAFGAVMFLLPVYLVTFSDYAGGEHAKLEIAIIIATYFIAELTVVPILGSLSDQWGRKPFLVAGPFIAAVSMLGFAVSTNFVVLCIAHAIQGIGAAAKVAPTIAFIADSCEPSERGEKMGTYDMVTFGGIGVGLLIGAALADWSKINPSVVTDIMKPQIFYMLAGILVIAGILTAIYVREFSLTGHTQETQDVHTPKPTSDHFTAVLDTFKNREFRRFAPSWFCIMMIIGMSTTFLPIILAGGAHSEVTGSSIESASTMIVGVGLLAITQPFFGRLSDKHGRKPFLLIGAVAAMIAIISLGFAVQEFILQGKNLTSELMKPANFYITIPLLLGILGAGAFGPSALALLADVTKAEKRGQAMGVYSFMLGLGEIMGDIIGGAFWDFFEGRYGEGSGPVGIVILGSTLSIIAVVVVVKYILETRYIDEIVHSVLKPVNNQETPPQT